MSDDGKVKRPLDSDELGRKGESKFADLCSDAKLICNKVDYDRVGWDFAVDFRREDSPDVELDKRRNPPSCLVQVKTVWIGGADVDFRLSSIERLVKDSRPSFVCVLAVADDLSIAQAHLIHARGPFLETVLKRLRSEQSQDRSQVNKMELSASVGKYGVEFAPTGAALKQALIDAIGNDPDGYLNDKQAELRSVGYGPGSLQIEMTVSVPNKAAWVDVQLGLARPKIESAAHYETRFGMRLKIPAPFDVDKMRFSIAPKCECQVVSRLNPRAQPAVFTGQLYLARDGDGVAGRIKCDHFEIVFRGQQISMTTDEFSVDKPELTADGWVRHFRFFNTLAAKGRGTLELRPRMKGMRPVIWNPNAEGSFDPDELAMDLALVERLSRLLKLAGVDDQPRIGQGQLFDQGAHIESADAIHAGAADLSPLSFSIDEHKELEAAYPHDSELKGFHVNFVDFGARLLVWSAAVTVRNSLANPRAFTSTAIDFSEIVMIEREDYGVYVAALKDGGTAFVMSRQLDDLPQNANHSTAQA